MKKNKRDKAILQVLLSAGAISLALLEKNAGAGNMTALDFKYDKTKSRLEITTDDNAQFEKTVSEADNQVIIDIKGTTVPKMLARKTDTSQFKSNIALVSAYQKESGSDARVVLQLKNKGDVTVTQEGSKIVALIDNGAVEAGSDEPAVAAPAAGAPGSDEAATLAEAAPAASDSKKSNDTAVINVDPDSVESFMESQSSKRYVGSKVSIQMMNADLQDIFRIIANASEFNILLSESVKGKMSLDLTDVPWDQVLDIVLKANKLSAERIANILRVLPMEDLQKEKDIEGAAKASAEAAEPLVSKIFPVSYAEPADVKKILDSYLSRDPKNPTLVRGAIDIDKRSNSLVVRETPSTIEKFKRIIKELDTQTPQILIEGKFVEVRENHARAFEGSIYGTTRADQGGTFSFHPGNNNYGAIFGGSPAPALSPLTPALGLTGVAQGMALGFAPKAAIIPGFPDIQALLAVTATDSESKVVASPRVVTQNRQAAQITSGQVVYLATAGGVGTAGGFQTVNAVLSLNVEPQVTNDGSINLKINFSQTTPTATSGSFNTSSVQSNVLVDSGATLVLGGVYNNLVVHSESGIPFLRDIPILGVLFGGKSDSVTKSELFIFISPRILNEKESGLKT